MPGSEISANSSSMIKTHLQFKKIFMNSVLSGTVRLHQPKFY